MAVGEGVVGWVKGRRVLFALVGLLGVAVWGDGGGLWGIVMGLIAGFGKWLVFVIVNESCALRTGLLEGGRHVHLVDSLLRLDRDT